MRTITKKGLNRLESLEGRGERIIAYGYTPEEALEAMGTPEKGETVRVYELVPFVDDGQAHYFAVLRG